MSLPTRAERIGHNSSKRLCVEKSGFLWQSLGVNLELPDIENGELDPE